MAGGGGFSREIAGQFALFSLLSIQVQAISGNETRYGATRNAPLTKAPDKRRQWLMRILPAGKDKPCIVW